MIEGGIIALAFTVLSLLFFFYLGYQNSTSAETADEFWFSGRELDSTSQFFTWFASVVAFSSGILYYMQVVERWGYAVYFASILSYIFGLLIAVFVALKSKVDFSKFRTVGGLVEGEGNRPKSGVLIDWLNFFSAMALVYIEIGIGVKIFSLLFKEPNLVLEMIMFASLAAIPFFYIRMGGFTAIVRSDVWQGILILIGLTAFLFYFLFWEGILSFPKPRWFAPTPSVGSNELLIYVVFAWLVNVTSIVPQAGLWQRLASVRQSEHSLFMRWLVPAAAVCGAMLVFFAYVLVASFILASGGGASSIGDVVRPILGGGDVAVEFIFPLVFVGFVAAMISSADSAALSAIMSVYGRRDVTNIGSDTWLMRRSKSLRTLLVSLGFLFAIHLYVETIGPGFGEIFLPAIFFLFSQLSIVAPVFVASIYVPKRLRSDLTIFVSVAIAWIVLLSATFTETFGKGLEGNLVGAIFGLTIVTVGCLKTGLLDFAKNVVKKGR
jgi:Na+/proline symporter